MKATSCEMCNRSLGNDSTAITLVTRECISRLSANPLETMELLKCDHFCREKDDPVKATSLMVLKDIYSSIKEDVQKLIHSPAEPLNEASVINFLTDSHSRNFLQDIVYDSFVSQKNNWRNLNVYSPRKKNLKQDVPSSVPPLDQDEVHACTEWVTPRLKSAKKKTNVSRNNRLKLSEIVLSDEESTDSSSSSSATVIEEEQFHKLARTVQDRFKSLSLINSYDVTPLDTSLHTKSKVLLVDRSCGTTPRSNRTPRRKILRNSVGVQTVFGEEMLEEQNSVKVQSNKKTSESFSSSKATESSSTTNSTIYSDLSAGQIPLRKAVLLLQSERRSLISVNPDGSVSTLNTRTKHDYANCNNIMDDNTFYENYGIALVGTSEKDSSGLSATTSRIPRVFDVKEDDEFEANLSGGNAAFSTPLINNNNNPSSVMFIAPEISMITSFESSSVTNMLQAGHEEYYRRVVQRESGSSFKVSDSWKQGDSSDWPKSSDELRESVEEEIIEVIKNMSIPNSSSTHSVLFSSKVNAIVSMESKGKSSEEEEESTLNQISPIPTTG